MKSFLILVSILLCSELQAQVETESTATTEVQTKKVTTEPPTEIEVPPVGESICKKGDLKACAKALKAKEGTSEFRASYDQVCLENKDFKCVKITIRGEPKEELEYQKSQNKKAYMFLTKEGGEDKIFVLDRKVEKK